MHTEIMADASVSSILPSDLRLGAVLARRSPGITLYLADLQLGKQNNKGGSEEVEHKLCSTCGSGHLSQGGALGLEEVIAIAKDVLEGLAQLHALHILHLDLKPGNILLDDYNHAYLSDFGISCALRTLEACTAVTSSLGTPHYMAPEQVHCKFGLRGSHTDVWGFAMTVLHLATGQLPYQGLYQMVFAMSKKHSPKVPSRLPEWLKEALSACLSFDTAARPSVSQLYEVFQTQASISQTDVSPEAACTLSSSLSAATAVNTAAERQHVYQETVVAARCEGVPEPGFVHSILAQLRSSEHSSQIEGATVISFWLDRGHQALFDPDNRQEITAVVSAGALPLLAVMLQSSQQSVQRAALDALWPLMFAGDNQTTDAVTSAGVLMPLVVLLKSPKDVVTDRVVSVISHLADDKRQLKAIVSAGTLQALVPWLHGPDRDMQQRAAGVMLQVAKDESSFDAIITAGALPCLQLLLANPTEGLSPFREHMDVWITARTLLCVLATGKQQSSNAAELSGAWPSLLASLESPSPRLQLDAARVVHHLARHSQQCNDAILMSGVLPSLVALLTSADHDLQEEAAKVLQQLAGHSKQSANAVISAGAVPPLVALLKAPKLWVLYAAVEAIVTLATDKSSINAVVSAGAIEPVTALLDSRRPVSAIRAVVMLHNIAASRQQHKEAIIAAGALPLLKRMLGLTSNPALSEAAADALQTLERPCVVSDLLRLSLCKDELCNASHRLAEAHGKRSGVILAAGLQSATVYSCSHKAMQSMRDCPEQSRGLASNACFCRNRAMKQSCSVAHM